MGEAVREIIEKAGRTVATSNDKERHARRVFLDDDLSPGDLFQL
jgi:hypothetical protein